MKMKRLLKDLYQEQKEKEPQVKVMDIIQLVLDLEDKVLEIKKKLKEIQPLVNPKPQDIRLIKISSNEVILMIPNKPRIRK